MLDLGACINVIPYHVYKDLKSNNMEKDKLCASN